MSDNVWIALIIAAGAVAVIYILRDKLKGTKVEVSKEGVKVALDTQEPSVTRIDQRREEQGNENNLTHCVHERH
ncbi:hypothetical protein [Candidatus Electronema sp. TJ]|uniref:hypothetical protein n=1 Tax=Candidatus Electronema sp. TJ TaxID=3401573 RepID=UPI003AA81285